METGIIKYFGGKGGEMLQIILDRLYPKRDIFVDAFGGSAKVIMSQHTAVEVYNDVEPNINALIKVIADDKMFKKFERLATLHPYSEELSNEAQRKIKNKNLPKVKRAFYFFYASRTRFNGECRAGFSSNVSIRRNMSKAVSDYLSAVEHLPQFHQRLREVLILKDDVFSVLEKYNQPNVMLYLDPPYHPGTRRSARYIVDFTANQHQQLVDTVLSMKAKILISGYDHPVYNTLIENGWTKESFEIKTVSGKREKKTKIETLWYNYNINDIRLMASNSLFSEGF